MPTGSTMRRYGGDWQPLLLSFADAVAACELPDTAWAVLSCPIEGLDEDADFLALIDADGDKRVRVDDVRAALRWTAGMLSDTAACTAGSAQLRIADIEPTKAGHRSTAEALAAKLDKGEAATLTLADLRNTEALCQCGDRNGDGVVPVGCILPELRERADAVLAICAPEEDRNGKPGLTRKVVDTCRQERDTYLAWLAEREDVCVWGNASTELAKRVLALDPAMRAWFASSRLAVIDPAAAAALSKVDVATVSGRDPTALTEAVQRAPLAPPVPGGALQLESCYPGHSQDELRQLAGILFVDQTSISEADWLGVAGLAAGIEAWRQTGEALPAAARADRLDELDDAFLDGLAELCDLDQTHKQHFEHLADLEKLLLYQQHLFGFCKNFIAFTDLFDPDEMAIFEQGTLIIAGRALHFSMLVHDVKAHKQRADEAGIHVLYTEVVRPGGTPEKIVVAVPVTRGDADGLAKGRRGVFHDRDGLYREAVIIDAIENPVSLAEALSAPFERIGGFLSKKLEGWSNKLEGDFDKQVDGMTKPKPAAPPAAVGASPLLGGTVAFAAMGSAFAFITKQLSEIGGPKILLALVVVCALIMVPTGLLAATRLYRRNLAGLIAASGWALNDPMRLTAGLGRLFTRRPRLPANVRKNYSDEALLLLRRVDPVELWRERGLTVVRLFALTSLLILFLSLAFPVAIVPWFEPLVYVAAGLQGILLLASLATWFCVGRFMPWYLWSLLGAPLAAMGLLIWWVQNHAG